MLLEAIDTLEIKSVLDFGCGKGAMVELLKTTRPNLQVYGWDPAFNDPDDMPDSVDLITSTDVLEHIENDKLKNTLEDLKSRSRWQYHLIACHKAATILPDGRNAHLIVQAPDWWKEIFRELGLIFQKEDIESRMSYVKEGSIAVVKYQCLLSKELS